MDKGSGDNDNIALTSQIKRQISKHSFDTQRTLITATKYPYLLGLHITYGDAELMPICGSTMQIIFPSYSRVA